MVLIMRALILAFGLVLAMNPLPDPPREALAIPDLCRSIFHYVDIHDIVGCLYVSKTFNMTSTLLGH